MGLTRGLDMRAALLAALFCLCAAPASAQLAPLETSDVIVAPVWATPPNLRLESETFGGWVTLVCPVHQGKPMNCRSHSNNTPADVLEAASAAAESAELRGEQLPVERTEGRLVVLQFLVTATDAPVASAPPPPTPTPTPTPTGISRVSWIERPNAAEFERYYPLRAYALELEGDVSLDCLVNSEGRLDCDIASEDPTDFGFGEAALALSRNFRMAPMTVDGMPTAGGRYRLRIPFRIADS